MIHPTALISRYISAGSIGGGPHSRLPASSVSFRAADPRRVDARTPYDSALFVGEMREAFGFVGRNYHHEELEEARPPAEWLSQYSVGDVTADINPRILFDLLVLHLSGDWRHNRQLPDLQAVHQALPFWKKWGQAKPTAVIPWLTLAMLRDGDEDHDIRQLHSAQHANLQTSLGELFEQGLIDVEVYGNISASPFDKSKPAWHSLRSIQEESSYSGKWLSFSFHDKSSNFPPLTVTTYYNGSSRQMTGASTQESEIMRVKKALLQQLIQCGVAPQNCRVTLTDLGAKVATFWGEIVT